MAKIGFVGATTSTLRLMQRAIRSGYIVPVLYTLQGYALQSKNRAVDLSDFCSDNSIDLVPISLGEHIKDPKYTSDIKGRNLDVLVESGFSQILPRDFLEAPRRGTVGFHYSPLPAYKGPASLNWALLLDKPEWGISLFELAPGIDEGAILGQEYFNVGSRDNINSLFDKADEATLNLFSKYLPDIVSGAASPITPKGESSHTRRFRPEEYQVNWNHSARQVHNVIRAFTWPFPGAYSKRGQDALFYWQSSESNVRTKQAPGTVIAAIPEKLRVACGDGYSVDISALSRIDASDMAQRESRKKVIGNPYQLFIPKYISPLDVIKVGEVLPSSTVEYPRP